MCCWLLVLQMEQKNEMVHIFESEREKLFPACCQWGRGAASPPPRLASFKWPNFDTGNQAEEKGLLWAWCFLIVFS